MEAKKEILEMHLGSEFYKLKELGYLNNIINAMEEYAKHIIEINFCDGSPIEFNELSIEQLKKIHKNVNMCVNWVNE